MPAYGISFVGAGKVALSLADAFHSSGNRIVSVVSRRQLPGEEFASKYGAVWLPETQFAPSTDIVIVSVPDQALLQVLSGIRCSSNTIVAHTAGSYGLDIFPDTVERPAVFYPLQTFSAERKVSLRGVPLFIETKEKAVEQILLQLALMTGADVKYLSAEERRKLHLAAVFVSNFLNHMLASGKVITDDAGIDFTLLKPLIEETVGRALEGDPELSQTGPAVRDDINTVNKHIDLLSFNPRLQLLYRAVSTSIMEHYNRNRR